MSNFRLSRLLPRFLRGDKDKNAGFTKDGSSGDTACRVLFLDDTELRVPFKGSYKGHYLMEKVFEHLNLFEKDYFGLRYIDHTGQTHWLDFSKSLASQLKGSSPPYTFYFGVKFYAADPCKLREEITRYLFFLQVKQDVLQGRLPITFDEAVELCGYAVQSELGDFDSKRCTQGYVSEFRFVQNQTEDLEARIGAMHRRLAGQVPAVVEYRYLDKAKWMEMYGVDLHPVSGESNIEYFLGLTPTGIVVYKNKTKIGNYFWPRITKVTFKGKVFIVRVRDKNNDEHTYAFELATKAGCKHLWKCCVEHHTFFRLNKMTDHYSRAGNVFRTGSKHRLSGRTERQAQREELGRQQPSVLRVPSRRQQRRINSDSRLSGHHSSMNNDGGPVMMVVAPEPVRPPRHRSLPELQGNESPRSVRSAPWERNYDGGLYTSGNNSPVSARSERHMYYRHNQGSDSESGVSHRRKYFPGRKGSDNESDVSAPRRRRREIDSGSESDVSYRNVLQNRRNRILNDNMRDQRVPVLYPFDDKENRPNGSIPSLHSAPGGEARQRRRRRRSKSPAKRPPDELRQHIEYDLVETGGMSQEQLREIAYTKVETKAEPFKIKYSPKTRQRLKLLRRKSFGDSDKNSQHAQSDAGTADGSCQWSRRESGPNRNSGMYVENSANNENRSHDRFGQVQSSPVVHMQDGQTAPASGSLNKSYQPPSQDMTGYSQSRQQYNRDNGTRNQQHEPRESPRSAYHHPREGSGVSNYSQDPHTAHKSRGTGDSRRIDQGETIRWNPSSRPPQPPHPTQSHPPNQSHPPYQSQSHTQNYQQNHSFRGSTGDRGYYHIPEGPTNIQESSSHKSYHRPSYGHQSLAVGHSNTSPMTSATSRLAPPHRPSPAPSDGSGPRSTSNSMISEVMTQLLRSPGYNPDLCTEL